MKKYGILGLLISLLTVQQSWAFLTQKVTEQSSDAEVEGKWTEVTDQQADLQNGVIKLINSSLKATSNATEATTAELSKKVATLGDLIEALDKLSARAAPENKQQALEKSTELLELEKEIGLKLIKQLQAHLAELLTPFGSSKFSIIITDADTRKSVAAALTNMNVVIDKMQKGFKAIELRGFETTGSTWGSIFSSIGKEILKTGAEIAGDAIKDWRTAPKKDKIAAIRTIETANAGIVKKMNEGADAVASAVSKLKTISDDTAQNLRKFFEDLQSGQELTFDVLAKGAALINEAIQELANNILTVDDGVLAFFDNLGKLPEAKSVTIKAQAEDNLAKQKQLLTDLKTKTDEAATAIGKAKTKFAKVEGGEPERPTGPEKPTVKPGTFYIGYTEGPDKPVAAANRKPGQYYRDYPSGTEWKQFGGLITYPEKPTGEKPQAYTSTGILITNPVAGQTYYDFGGKPFIYPR